jgi:NCAIR mutase (PurE)-related protein
VVTTEQDSDVDVTALTQLLDDVRDGRVSPDDAVTRIQHLPFTDLGFARVDHHRALRQGRAETVFGPGKTPAQCAAIVSDLLAHDATSPIILTRATEEQWTAAFAHNPGGVRTGTTLVWRAAPPRDDVRVVVITAGTSDLPVADEAAATLAAHGIDPERITDVGVAGIHRLLAVTDRLMDADAVIVVAGMEGALASVVGGLTGVPVIAVPTSVGYGASLDGVTALLGMLASCASGLTVVGIDNGFGAASAVLRQLHVTAPAPGAPAAAGRAEVAGDRGAVAARGEATIGLDEVTGDRGDATGSIEVQASVRVDG